MAGTPLATNHAGDLLLWALAVPLYGLAVVRTRVLSRWIRWPGLFVGVTA
jgi:hypothetical protein